VTDVVVLLE